MRHWANLLTRGAAKLTSPFAVALVLALALAAITSTPQLESLFGSFDRLHFDMTTLAFANRSSSRVVLIRKGERSLRELGRKSVFSPATNAQLIDRLSDAASIVFDIPLPAREQYDEMFFDAVARNKRVVLSLPSTDTDESGRLLLPLPEPAPEAAAAIGQRDVTIGHYGVVTGFVPYRTIDGVIYPHVSLEAIVVAGVSKTLPNFHRYEFPQITAIGRHPSQSVLLMLPRAESLETYSFADVVKGRIPSSAFKGKIVFIGHAIYRPFGMYNVSSLNDGTIGGSQLDALIASALLDNDIVREIPSRLQLPVDLALALGMLLICWLARTRSLHLYALAWGLGILVVSTLLLGLLRIWIPIGSALAVCMAVYSYFAWSQLLGMHRLLHREIGRLRELSSSVGVARFSGDTAHASGKSNLLDEVKLAMQQIREWQEAYVGVINLLPYPIFLERARKLVLWNSRAAELLGATVTDPGDADAGEQPKLKAVLEDFAAQNLGNAPSQGREIAIDGRQYILVSVPFAQLSSLSPQENAAHLICLVDIDDLKRAVTQDRQALRHIAHDLRNPLSTILALIEQQSEGMPGSLSGAHDGKFMHDLRRLVGYSLRMAQDFMQLSRAEVLDPSTFSLVAIADVVDEAVDHIGAFADSKSIRLEMLPHEGDAVLVDGNRDMLLRAVINVLDNAIKYSPQHTVIGVALAQERQPAQNYAVIRVTDQGIGIPEQALPRLCEPFFQVDGKRSDATAGVGLGLSFVRAVIDRHGGKISIVSEIGRGTAVALFLPIDPGSPVTDADGPLAATMPSLSGAC